MERGKRIAAINGEFLLPEPIIQHIQSFLSVKQAAQTSILSKSWYTAWSTRPNLDFDERDFLNRGDGDPKPQITRFLEFAKRTVQRYEELNLKIESFRLWMRGREMDNAEQYSSSLANELIVKAMKMGAADLNFQLQAKKSTFVLPYEVLGSETLIRLSVAGCAIDRLGDGKVSCSSLKSLNLSRVYIKGDLIWDIISSCPLIEKLLLSECLCLRKHRGVVPILNPYIKFVKENVGSVADGTTDLYEFHKLKCLLLEKVNIDTFFFSDFASKFPCLKDLTIQDCKGCKGMQISSRSLECISLTQEGKLTVKFDVPRIRKFSFSGSSFPSLSFKTASREWESDISIMCNCHPSTSWFVKLRKFLTRLSLSKISLSLRIRSIMDKSFDYAGRQGLPTPVVYNLTLHEPSSVCSALLDGLFWSCHPKFITQYWLPRSGIRAKENNDFLVILCKRLVQEVSENCCIPNRYMFGQCDLEEVNVELFEDTAAEWWTLSWKTLLEASASLEDKRKIRFQLRWGLESITLG